MISNGLAPIVKLYVNKNGEFMSGMIYSIKQVGEGGPIIDTENSLVKEIINLTASGVPESEILINPNG